MPWDFEFHRRIEVAGRRKSLITLRDAAEHMTSLSRKEQNAEYWRPAATLLRIIGEKGGCMFMAEIAVRHGLRKGVKDPPPEYDPERKRPRPWGNGS